MKKPKKVLIVCYYWPPAGGPGVQRWLKFVKYLPSLGFEPIVYIPENPSYPIKDETLLNEVPDGIRIIRKPIKEPYKVASLLSGKQTKTISSGIVPVSKKQTIFQKLLLYIRGNYFVPDARIGWVKPSISFLSNYLQQEKIKTIITTGPPHSMHLIGLGVKKGMPTIKWLADFRDPWTTIGYHDKLKMTSKTQKKHKALEHLVLNTADRIIVTSPQTKLDFKQITNTPIDVITNGYDIDVSKHIYLNSNFTLSHIGSLLSNRNPIILWKVISDIIANNEAFQKVFKLSLSGRISEEVLTSIKSYGLESYLDLEGYVSHPKAIELQRSSNLLLLIEIDTEQTKSIIPGKVFEYLAARRPILAIGPQGSDIENIITSTTSGTYHTYKDEKSIKTAILKYFKKFQNKEEKLQEGDITMYHRKELTRTLVESISK